MLCEKSERLFSRPCPRNLLGKVWGLMASNGIVISVNRCLPDPLRLFILDRASRPLIQTDAVLEGQDTPPSIKAHLEEADPSEKLQRSPISRRQHQAEKKKHTETGLRPVYSTSERKYQESLITPPRHKYLAASILSPPTTPTSVFFHSNFSGPFSIPSYIAAPPFKISVE